MTTKKTTMNEDVSPIKNDDVPLSCWFSRGSTIMSGKHRFRKIVPLIENV